MDVIVLAILLVFALAGVYLAAAATKALREFSRSEVETVCEERGWPHRYDEILQHHEPVALAAELLQNLWIVISLALLFALVRATIPEAGWQVVVIELLLAAGVLIVLQSWLPWTWVRLGSERFLVITWPVWRITARVLWLPVAMARMIDAVIFWLFDRQQKKLSDESFEDELMAVVDDGQRDGHILEQTADMIEGVIEMRDVEVREIMTPRTDMLCVPYDARLDDAVELVRSVGHTRFPAFGKDRDDIRGILHVRDLLMALVDPQNERNGRTLRVRDIIQEAVFVPETKTIDVLLAEFRANRKHMAIVSDEFGGVSGLITIEDILEEIVGDIVDEHDSEDEFTEELAANPDGTFDAPGRMRIDEVNDELHLEIPVSDDYDTLGGLVFNTLGHMPQVNEEVTSGNARLTVLRVDRRRVDRLRITRLQPSQVSSNDSTIN